MIINDNIFSFALILREYKNNIEFFIGIESTKLSLAEHGVAIYQGRWKAKLYKKMPTII